jgi:hypothetical protein
MRANELICVYTPPPPHSTHLKHEREENPLGSLLVELGGAQQLGVGLEVLDGEVAIERVP